MGTEAHLGYEGLAFLGVKPVLGSGSAIPRTSRRLVSSGGYGGKMTGAGLAVGSPYNYDWSDYQGNLGFDVNNVILPYIIPWFYNRRNEPMPIQIRPRVVNSYMTFNECWWDSFTLSTSQSSLVSASLGFMALEMSEYSWGGAYGGGTGGDSPIPIRGGGGGINGSNPGVGSVGIDTPQWDYEDPYVMWYSGMFQWVKWLASTNWISGFSVPSDESDLQAVIQAVNNVTGGMAVPNAEDLFSLDPVQYPAPSMRPIGYWDTAIAAQTYGGALTGWDVTDWNLSFSQPVERFFACNGSGATTSPREPLFMGVGPLTVKVSGTWVGPREWAVANNGLGERLETLSLYVPFSDGTRFILNQLRQDEESDPVRGQAEITGTSFAYEAFGIDHTF